MGVATGGVACDDLLGLVDALDAVRQRVSAASTTAMAYGALFRAEGNDEYAEALDVMAEDLLGEADELRAVSAALGELDRQSALGRRGS